MSAGTNLIQNAWRMNYYISTALLWKDYDTLQTKVDDFSRSIPWTHWLVPRPARHCTLFAIARLIHFRNPYSTPSEAMRSILHLLPVARIATILEAHLRSLRVRASEFRIYENSSSIQFFVENGSIALMRKELSCALEKFSLPADPSVCVDFPMMDTLKNEGDSLFGSFARRVEQTNDNPLLYRESIPEFPFFEPKSVQITVSDDALTNIRQRDCDHLIVPLK